MALPTAPMGQLSNLSVPYQIEHYQKPASGIDRALAAFLSGVAQQAGGQLAENALSRDYAPDGQKAGFFGKLVSGPVENRQQQMQKQGQEFEMEKMNADIGAQNTRQQNEQDFLARQLASQQAEQELGRMDTGMQNTALEKLRQSGDMSRMTEQEKMQLENALQLEHARAGDVMAQSQQESIDREGLERLKASLEAGSPQGQYQGAEAQKAQMEAQRLKAMLDMFMKPQTGGGVRPQDLKALHTVLAQ